MSAQLKVESNGRVQVGVPNNSSSDPAGVATMQLFGKNSMATGSKLTFGDFGTYANNGWNVLVGEYGTTDTDLLWLHGKKGMYFTYWQSNNVIAAFDTEVGNGTTFHFFCDVKSNGILLTSDERLKDNIKPLSGSLSSLQKLGGVSYRLKDELPGWVKRHDGTLVSSKSTNLTEKEKKEVAFFENLKKENERNKKLKLGFLAQDIKNVFPNLVSEEKDGTMSVDYIGLIPVIVESIKEQQQIIEAQSKKIKELESTNNNKNDLSLRSANSTTLGIDDIPNSELANAFLYQNVPNPFNERTEIHYFLPEEVKSAEIYVFDMQGILLKKVPVNKTGSVEIQGSNLKAGMYLYTLVADGKQVDTKRMILTK